MDGHKLIRGNILIVLLLNPGPSFTTNCEDIDIIVEWIVTGLDFTNPLPKSCFCTFTLIQRNFQYRHRVRTSTTVV